jgi:hypothetical protein
MHALEQALQTFHDNNHIFLEHEACKDFHAIPKLHTIEHYTILIRSKGSPDRYSTEVPERLHIEFAEKAYRASNKHEFVQQMVKWLRRQEAMNLTCSYLAWRLKYHPPPISDDPDPPTIDSHHTGGDKANDESDSPPPIAAHISNPLKLGHNFGIKLAKKPQLPNQDVQSLIKNHGALDFQDALKDALVELGFPKMADRLDFSCEVFDVWSRLEVGLPQACDLSSSKLYEVILASPARLHGWRKTTVPSEFGSALILRDGEGHVDGLDGEFHVVRSTSVYHSLWHWQGFKRYSYGLSLSLFANQVTKLVAC